MTAQFDTQLVYMQPHMHLRGKDFEVRLISTSGESKTIFKAKWDFNWQLDLISPNRCRFRRNPDSRHRALR
jgi:hypothetical protein